MPQRLLIFALLSLAAATGAHDASALGFGRAQPSAVLGQPLDFSVVIRLDAGEVLPPACVSAEVAVGDAVLPRSSVGASLESVAGVASIRVRTGPTIEEPVVSVTVTAGCDGTVSRRFTLFADPPGLGTGMPPLAEAEPAAVAALPLARDVSEPAVAPAQVPSPAASARQAAPGSSVAAPTAARAARPAKPAQAARPAPASRSAKPAERPRPAVASAGRPRLRLDPPGTATVLAADAAASEAERDRVLRAAEEAVSAAQVAASAAASRVAALEAGIEEVKRDAQAQREQTQRLGQALAEAESRGDWTPLLLAALVALLGMMVWLLLKLREFSGERAGNRWNEQRAPADAPVEGAAEEAAEEAAPTGTTSAAAFEAAPVVVRGVQHPLVPNEQTAQAAADRTDVLPGGALMPDAPTRDVSIDELLDLEQQAEFFIVLGQDDAAIELLVEHLRSSGGTSPLPYLKLMDIYRRLGDEAAYERTRHRFNHRFNAVAPGWAVDLRHGRTLETYPDVIARLQHSWPRSVDAMADLETLLFRSDGHELFELPAYREVLFLYSLARDLLEHGEDTPSKIDVLLPLSEGERFTTTSAYPSASLEHAPAAGADTPIADLATAPVDLDLTEPTPARAPSQFGFFEETPAKTS